MVVRWQQWWRRHGVRVHRHFHEAGSSLSCKMLYRAQAVNYGSLHIRCSVSILCAFWPRTKRTHHSRLIRMRRSHFTNTSTTQTTITINCMPLVCEFYALYFHLYCQSTSGIQTVNACIHYCTRQYIVEHSGVVYTRTTSLVSVCTLLLWMSCMNVPIPNALDAAVMNE